MIVIIIFIIINVIIMIINININVRQQDTILSTYITIEYLIYSLSALKLRLADNDRPKFRLED